MRATKDVKEMLLELKHSFWLPPFQVRAPHLSRCPRPPSSPAALLSSCRRRSPSVCPRCSRARTCLHVARDCLDIASQSQADGVRSAVEAMIAQYDESRNLQRLAGVDMSQLEDSAAPIVRMLTMLRNRDMLLCYLRHRMNKIESARWDVAGGLPEESLDLLSPNEKEYDREYADLLSEYQTSYDLDLMRDTKPPTDLYIKVLAREEVGAFVGPESGATIDPMRGGDMVFLRRGDVEPLIRQGKLEHVAF